MTEKELAEKILRERAVVKLDGTIDMNRMNKLVTEPWLWNRARTYGWLEAGNIGHDLYKEEKHDDTAPVAEAPKETITVEEQAPVIDEKQASEETVTPDVETVEAPEAAPVTEPEAAPVVEETVAEEPAKTTKKTSKKK